MQLDLMAMMTQFGMSGLIAWMWLTERRAATSRERQLTEAHERLMDQRIQLDALLQVVADNARAVSAIEAGQRALASLLEAFIAPTNHPIPRVPSTEPR